MWRSVRQTPQARTRRRSGRGEGGVGDFFDGEGLGWAEDGGFHGL